MWDHQLTKWERVVKIGSNLGGPKRNVVVIRNWPTFTFPDLDKPEPKTALYLGNLGYGHDVGLLVRACDDLRDNDYRISIRADGPGVALLPAWLKAEPVCKSVAESREALLRHEIHLIAAHPKIEQAIFPSKIWNSFAAKRETICTGFSGEMAEELRNVRIAPFARHLAQWVEMLQSMERGPAVSTHPSLGSRRLTPEMQPVAVGR